MKECSHCHQEIIEPLSYRKAPNLAEIPKVSKKFKLPISVKIYGRIILKTLFYIGITIGLLGECFLMGSLLQYLFPLPFETNRFEKYFTIFFASLAANVCLIGTIFVIWWLISSYLGWAKKQYRQYKNYYDNL